MKKFYGLGSKIVATDNQEKLEKLKNNFPNIFIEKFKLDEHDKIEKFIELVNDKLEGFDILVNNAGITIDNLSIRLPEKISKRVIDVNLTSTFNVQICYKKCLKKIWENYKYHIDSRTYREFRPSQLFCVIRYCGFF